MDDMSTKIAKLLALAERTANPSEAEAFTAKAEALMMKYGIEQAMLQTAGTVPAESISLTKRTYTGRSYGYQQMKLAWLVATALNLQAHYAEGERDHYTLTMVGFDSDLALGTQLIDSLQLQCTSAALTWWKANAAQYVSLTTYAKRQERRGFIDGFGYAAAQRVKVAYAREVAAAESTTAGTEVALLDRTRAVESYYADAFPNVRRSRGRSAGGSDSRAAGGVAGRSANIGARGGAVGGGRRSVTS